MIQFTIIQTLVFLLYVGYIYKKFGVIHSISQSWYELPHTQKWMFTAFTWILGLTLLLMDTTLFFISGIGFIIVGSSAMFDDDTVTKLTHYTGAGIGILFAFLALTFELEFAVPIVLYAAAIMLEIAFRQKNVIWWIEIWAFVFLMLGFYIVELR